jgi:hypothetical protein
MGHCGAYARHLDNDFVGVVCWELEVGRFLPDVFQSLSEVVGLPHMQQRRRNAKYLVHLNGELASHWPSYYKFKKI